MDKWKRKNRNDFPAHPQYSVDTVAEWIPASWIDWVQVEKELVVDCVIIGGNLGTKTKTREHFVVIVFLSRSEEFGKD